MKVIAILRRCLKLLLERSYYLEKWIGDKSLLSILQSKFDLNEIDKGNLNRCLPSTKFQKIIIHTHKEHNLKYNDKVVNRAYFYYLSKSYNSIPTQNTREEWTNVYFNF